MTLTKLIASIALGFLITQTIKTFLAYKRTKKPDLSVYLQNGGMPSAHTATVISLTTAMFLETGLSELFVVCVVLSLIVMNDAMKVRKETEEEAKVLNIVMEKEHIIHKRLTETVGHTPAQVAAGLIIGILIPIIVYSL